MNSFSFGAHLAPPDRRNNARARTLKSGKLVYGGISSVVIDCFIVDISSRGARVETSVMAHVPEELSLALNGGDMRRAYRRWALGNQIGLEFADEIA